ncbi:DUF397 domain-containing protein [Kitasatospora cystarginea]|uniref:DUF397 domain-containing protein n=1 Tax=Kitasatospora cystarginea TaxID=58350 RepID=A0ABN3DQ14_9ACTN
MSTEARVSTESDGLVWVKSSHSGGEGGECIEVAAASAVVHVRDSKDREGPRLTFTPEAWAAFAAFAAQL